MQAAPTGGDPLDDDDDGGIFAEINITPLTDVFMVLLIIMMVVSSSIVEDEKEAAYEKGLLAERALQVMTPEAGAGDSELVVEDVAVSVLPDRSVFIDDEAVPLDQLDGRFQAIAAKDPRTRIVLRGDKGASYDIIMDIIARLTNAGLRNIALASRQG
ncbi:MAG: biopolymer transporter ExbD [Deltaproteobacteria bacterium]|jgi:biopolymer transport protein ExbD|nr:biopolymer transporter ExbD [Deltaproteobacteria bacterium]